jgi:hypothetical protein
MPSWHIRDTYHYLEMAPVRLGLAEAPANMAHLTGVLGYPSSYRRARTPQPRKPVQMVGTRPHPPPAVTLNQTD